MAFDYSKYNDKIMTPAEAVKLVKDGDTVFIGIISDTAYVLADALWERRDELHDVSIALCDSLRECKLLSGTEPNPFKKIYSAFVGLGERAGVKVGRELHYTSVHLSLLDRWFRDILKPTVALLNVSEPDENGYVSFGAAGSCGNHFALKTADRVILQVNKSVPYVYGSSETRMHISEADAICLVDDPLLDFAATNISPETQTISDIILDMVPDTSTIQLGIGTLSTAIGYGLKTRNDLGVYSEMFSDPLMELIKNGNVTNKYKGFREDASVYAFSLGTRKLYDWMNYNDKIAADLFTVVNDPRNISKNKNMVSINSAMAINVYGETAADNMAFSQHSAVGGQMDFVKGAQWSEGGKSIIATESSFVKNGKRQSKIVLDFPTGTAVTTPRSEVEYIVTEYGCVNVKKLAMPDRIRALIGLAHPDFREELLDQAKEHKIIY